MKKQIRTMKDQIVQITTVDERWYARPKPNPFTGLPGYEFVPSVTWICEHYPKGIGFYKWLADKGWDEAEAIKEAAGDKGSKVHQAISVLLDGLPIKMEDSILNPSTGEPEPLTLEEYEAILSFARWHQAVRPELVAKDTTVWNDVEGYAGTVDLVCRIDGALWLLDFKTSKAVYPSHEMQVTAYKHAHAPWAEANLGILQLGYARNKAGYKFTEVNDQWSLFLASKQIWANETAGQTPRQKDYPLQISLMTEPATAQARLSNGTDTEGAVHGGTVGLGEEKQQNGDLGGQRIGDGDVRRVQDQRQSVRRGKGNRHVPADSTGRGKEGV